MNRLLAIVFLFAASLPAAASRPEPLADPAMARKFVIAADLPLYRMILADTQEALLMAKACTYVEAFRDRAGDYYVGDLGCLVGENLLGDGRTMNHLGGVFIPKNPRKPPRMYSVVGPVEADCKIQGLLLCLLDNAESGRFRLMPGKMEAAAAAAIRTALDAS